MVQKKLTPEQDADLAARYQGGSKQKHLSHVFGVSPATVANTLHRLGVTFRTQSESRRQYPLNETAFDDPGPEGRYWVGMLMTDGCVATVSKRYLVVALGLAVRDRGHVERFRGFLGSTAPLILVPPTVTYILGQRAEGTGMVRFVASSMRLAAALARFGVVPRKSRTAEVVGLEGDRDFWRGAIDGDGSVYWVRPPGRQPSPVLSLVGSRPLVHQFAAFARGLVPESKAVPREARPGLWRIKYSTEAARRLVCELYQDGDVALARKQATAEEVRGWRAAGRTSFDPPGVCSAPGCGRPFYAVGVCRMHYKRGRRAAGIVGG